MQTQSSSKARIKQDTVGSDGLKQLFEQYSKQNVDQFRETCKNVIEASSGKASTKATFIGEVNRAYTKDKMLKTVTNYILAGQGLGV